MTITTVSSLPDVGYHKIDSSDDDTVIYRRKRSYSELKITGPPLYSQGDLARDPQPQEEIAAKTSPKKTSSYVPLSDPDRTALLVVDVQPEYWSECSAVRQDFPTFPTNIASLIEHCRDDENHVKSIVWVRAEYSYEKSPWLEQFSRIHEGRIPPVVKPSSKWESFAEPKQDDEKEHVMNKTSWSSTSNTKLLDHLRQKGIDTVLVCGLITSVCVQHSAFGVFEAGFRTILVTDCCADRGKARHDAALALYGGYMYELRTVDSVKKELQRQDNNDDDEEEEAISPHCLFKTTGAATTSMRSSSSSATSLTTIASERGEGTVNEAGQEPIEF